MYGFKHFIGSLANPLLAGALIGLLALLCKLLRRRQWAIGLSIGALAVAYLGSTPLIGDALLSPLERQYPPLPRERPLPNVSYIVVLGSGYAPHDGVPVTAALDPDGLARVVEAVQIARRLPAARLVLSGGSPDTDAKPAVGYVELARELGVRDEAMIIMDKALDTRAEAHDIAQRLGKTPFILVTTASHMPRAMALMKRAGTAPIPAPTGQRVSGNDAFEPGQWLPDAGGLDNTEHALHEYLGLAALDLGLE